MADKKYNQGVAVFCKRCNKPFLSWGLPANETIEEHLKTSNALDWIEKGYAVDSFSPSSTLSDNDWCFGSKDSCKPYKAGEETLIHHTFSISKSNLEKLEILSQKNNLSMDQLLEMMIDEYGEK